MKRTMLSLILAILMAYTCSGCIWLLAAAVIDKSQNTERTKVENEHEEHMLALQLQEARCAPGTYLCGNFCPPNGSICCASVGHPETYCKQGESCNSNGTCNGSVLP